MSYFPPEVLKSDDVLQGMFNASRTPGNVAYQAQFVQLGLKVTEDGSFRVDDVPAGTYRLTTWLTSLAVFELNAASGRRIANLEHFFTVPEMPGGRSDEPFDLGTVTVSLRLPKPLSDGNVAPSIEFTTLEGKRLKLADYRGNSSCSTSGRRGKISRCSRFPISRMWQRFMRASISPFST